MTFLKRSFILFIGILAGCGGKAEPSKAESSTTGDSKDNGSTKTATSTEQSGTAGIGGPKAPEPPGPSLLAPHEQVQQLAERFIADLRTASDTPGPMAAELLKRVSPDFLKAIGKPLLTEGDKKLGYSTEAASAWLRRAGSQLVGIGLPTGYGTPAAAVFVGTFGNGTGRFLIRMAFTEGWKIDWFSLGTLTAPQQKPSTTEGSYQDFAVLAFLDALTSHGVSKEDRELLLGALLSSKLKQAWAAPFEQDKIRGYDFSPSILGEKIDAFGKDVTGFSRTSADADIFKIELVKGKTNTSYTLKLVKGNSPGQWLVEEFR